MRNMPKRILASRRALLVLKSSPKLLSGEFTREERRSPA